MVGFQTCTSPSTRNWHCFAIQSPGKLWFWRVGWVVMKFPQVPPDISHTTGKSRLFLSLLGFPITPPNPGRATDVFVHAIPSLIKEVTIRQPRSQTPLTIKYQHTLFASNMRTGKSTLESHTALCCTMASFSP